MTPTCARCGAELADGAYVCLADALSLAETLRTAAGHAEDALTVIARQARYGTGSRGAAEDQLPYDDTASTRLAKFATAVSGWGRIVTEHTGRRPRWRQSAGPLCPTGVRCEHDSCAVIRRRTPPPPLALEAAWLSRQVETLRRHPAAAEAFDELHTACADLARLVDRPAVPDLVGMCDCGRTLYAPPGRRVVQCPQVTCKLIWDVERSREILRQALDGKLVTAAEAARLAAYLGTDRTQEQIRKLVNAWASRRLIVAHGEIEAEPAYRFGDVAVRLAQTPRRERRMAA